METATCVFDLLNDGDGEMLLYLEPEGSRFVLLPGKTVQVRLFGNTNPIEMQHSCNDEGLRTISFWPANGGFELFFEGSSVWETL